MNSSCVQAMFMFFQNNKTHNNFFLEKALRQQVHSKRCQLTPTLCAIFSATNLNSIFYRCSNKMAQILHVYCRMITLSEFQFSVFYLQRLLTYGLLSKDHRIQKVAWPTLVSGKQQFGRCFCNSMFIQVIYFSIIYQTNKCN